MRTDIPGLAARFEELKPGDCFAYRSKGNVAIGLKLDAPINTSRIANLSRGSAKTSEPFIVPGTQPATLVVQKLDAAIMCGWDGVEIRDGVSNPRFGQVVAAGARKFLCVRDAMSDDDPVFIDLECGARAGYRAEGPSAVFLSWSIVLTRGDDKEVICSFVVPRSED